MSIGSLMNSTCAVLTERVTKSPTGGANLTSWSTKVPLALVRVCDLKPFEAQVYYGRFGAKKVKRFYFAQDPTISDIADHILWNGQYWQVVNIQNAGGNTNRLWMIDAVFKVSQGVTGDDFGVGFSGGFQ
jgi:hypothetical protein